MEDVTSEVVRWLVIIASSFLVIALVLTIIRGIKLLEVLNTIAALCKPGEDALSRARRS